MPLTNGFNHVATRTTDMHLTVRFYEQAFDAVVTFEEVPKREDHPWMKILDFGGGAALNVFEVHADEIIGDRRRQGGRGAIDHHALCSRFVRDARDAQRALGRRGCTGDEPHPAAGR